MAKKPVIVMGNSAHEQAEAEAAAFDARITERERAGYIPDIRRAVKCDYFYKSFLFFLQSMYILNLNSDM